MEPQPVNPGSSEAQASPSPAGDGAAVDAVDDILDQWRTERPDLDPTSMGIFGRISRIHTLSRARQTATLARFGLNFSAFDVLANLRRSGPPFRKSPSELATSSILTSGGVTFRLDKLEALGLIRRIPSREDRRAIHAELTPRGLELIDQVMGAHLDTGQAMLGRLSGEDVTRLAELLRALERSVTSVEVLGGDDTG